MAEDAIRFIAIGATQKSRQRCPTLPGEPTDPFPLVIRGCFSGTSEGRQNGREDIEDTLKWNEKHDIFIYVSTSEDGNGLNESC